jgi:hypothetical protein
MKVCYFSFVTLLLWVSCTFVHAQNSLIDQIKNFQIEKLEGKELIVSFTTSIDTLPTKTVGLKIKKGKLFKNGEYYGSFKLVDKIRISNKLNKDLRVRIRIVLEKELNVMEEGLKALLGSPLELEMTGNFNATWFVFWKKYPFDFKEKVSLKSFIK